MKAVVKSERITYNPKYCVEISIFCIYVKGESKSICSFKAFF